MKHLYTLLLVIALPIVLILMSYNNGSPGGRTGSLGDSGNTCTGCHTGNANTVEGWISTNIPPEGYTPGETYLITATGTHTGVVKFGFELTVENSLGAKVGTLQLVEPNRTKYVNSNKAITHTATGNTPSGNTNTWTMNWIAPSNVNGDVGIYAAFNAANGNGNTSGDVIYTSSKFVSEFVPVPLLVGIQPDNAIQGEMITTTITGQNTQFSEIPNVYLSYSGNGLEVINATDVTVESETELTAGFNIPVSASAGLWDLHVDALVLENTFTIDLATDIALNQLSELKVYPNPASDYFYVEQAAGSEITVYNAAGEMLVFIKDTDEKQIVDIRNLSGGLYLVKVISGEGNQRTFKLLVD